MDVCSVKVSVQVPELEVKLIDHLVYDYLISTSDGACFVITLGDFQRGVDVGLRVGTSGDKVGYKAASGTVVLLETSSPETVFIVKL